MGYRGDQKKLRRKRENQKRRFAKKVVNILMGQLVRKPHVYDKQSSKLFSIPFAPPLATATRFNPFRIIAADWTGTVAPQGNGTWFPDNTIDCAFSVTNCVLTMSTAVFEETSFREKRMAVPV